MTNQHMKVGSAQVSEYDDIDGMLEFREDTCVSTSTIIKIK